MSNNRALTKGSSGLLIAILAISCIIAIGLSFIVPDATNTKLLPAQAESIATRAITNNSIVPARIISLKLLTKKQNLTIKSDPYSWLVGLKGKFSQSCFLFSKPTAFPSLCAQIACPFIPAAKTKAKPPNFLCSCGQSFYTTTAMITVSDQSSSVISIKFAHLIKNTSSCQGLIVPIHPTEGENITLHQGQILHLYYPNPSSIIWSHWINSNPKILQATSTTSKYTTFSLKAKGRVNLSTTGRPNCKKYVACPQYIILLRIHVTVSSAIHLIPPPAVNTRK